MSFLISESASDFGAVKKSGNSQYIADLNDVEDNILMTQTVTAPRIINFITL